MVYDLDALGDRNTSPNSDMDYNLDLLGDREPNSDMDYDLDALGDRNI